jgi:hypothetical protein
MLFRIRRIRCVIASVVAIIGFGAVSTVPSAAATEPGSTTRTFNVTEFSKTVDQECPKGSVKLYTGSVKIKRGVDGKITGKHKNFAGFTLENGKPLFVEGVKSTNARQVYFTVIAGRKSKLSEGSGDNWFTVTSDVPKSALKVLPIVEDCGEKF